MNCLFSIVLVAGLVWVAFVYWMRLAGDESPYNPQWFLAWVGKGLGVPLVVWLVFNTGLLLPLPPLMTDIAMAKAGGGPWLPVLLETTAPALGVMGTCWTAVSLAWFVAAAIAQAEKRGRFFDLCVYWSFFSLPLAGLILYCGGWWWSGFAVLVWLFPIAHNTWPLAEAKPPLLYSRAIANMKFGKYAAAEWEVIRELEKCEDDFAGWMLLAELYANHFNDLKGADQTVHELCRQPNVNGSQFAVAIHRLADWHLNLGEDPIAARRVLEEICAKLPGTHLDRMARQRLNQLPATPAELREQRKGRTLHLPALRYRLDEPTERDAPKLSPEESVTLANPLVEKLTRNPNDVSAREELARIFAGPMARVDLAIEQVELLLAMPRQPAQKMAEWLALIAAWQLTCQHDAEKARVLLKRLVRDYPQSPQAFAAQQRLTLMDVEQRMRKLRSGASSANPLADGSEPQKGTHP